MIQFYKLKNLKDLLIKTSKYFKKRKEANLFLIIVLCAGSIMACINPPFQECDGWFHYLIATDVSYGNLFSPWVNITSHEDGLITVPENLDEITYRIVTPRTGEGRQFIQHLKNIKFSKERKEVELSAAYVSLFYYPQALGYFLGRCFQISIYESVVLSRICNLLTFLLLTYAAVAIIPILKNTLAVIALFPLTLYQAASGSPDAILNGLCFLFTALCFYYAYGDKERLGLKDVWKLGMLLGIIFLCKYIYVCLGLLIFLIPMKKFKSKKEYWKCFGIALIPMVVIGCIGAVNAFFTVAFGQPTTAVAGGEMTQVQYLTKHPTFIIHVLLHTFLHEFAGYMVGLNTLGSLNYSLEPLIFIVPMFAVFIGCLDYNKINDKVNNKDKILCFCTFLSISVGAIVAMYLGDRGANEVGTLIVQGVQGRYFIPAIPVFFAAISQKGIQNRIKYFTEKAIGGMGVLLAVSIYILYSCG